MKTTWMAAAWLMGGACAAGAQTIAGLSLDKAQAQTGQAVTATVKFDASENPNCGLRFYWGDGATEDIKVVEATQTPLVLRHTYSKPGTYALMAEGKKVTSHLKCQGANARASVTVLAPAPVMTAPAVVSSPAPAAVAGSPCPGGWKLDAKSVNRQTGAFTCTAKPGTPLPGLKLQCVGDTGYFENSKKGQLGCRL